ncbi:MAG: ATP synthase F1 subunit epsilon [Bdellovibrionales bacterium]|nr:ATP synthase F1 subunit epsilon [Bdellovibrionales bacterium]
MINLTLVTPSKTYLNQKSVEEVIIPAYRGEIAILDGHSPLLTTLDAGVLQYKLEGEKDFHRVAISWGYCEVGPDGVKVLSETCESAKDVDKERAKQTKENAIAKLMDKDITPELIQKYQRKLRRAQARLDV